MTRKRAPGVGTPRASGMGKGRRDSALPRAEGTRRTRSPKPGYWEVLADVIEDAAELTRWARKAVVARR